LVFFSSIRAKVVFFGLVGGQRQNESPRRGGTDYAPKRGGQQGTNKNDLSTAYHEIPDTRHGGYE